MRKYAGFTVIEMSFALVIIGIISAAVFMGLNSYFRYNNFEKEVWKVFKDFSSLRGKAMKNDCTIRVDVISSEQYSLLTDFNNNSSADSGEAVDTITLPSSIVFGLPSDQPPESAPSGLSLPPTGSFASGNWDTSGILIDSTATAVVNTGSTYLSSPIIGKYTFCIAVADSTQLFKMYKWDGATWTDLR
jgi:prepilin-type N-terminal cleavage/methylation domain-containing protein